MEDQIIKYAQPYSVTLSRSTKGVTSWELKARHEDFDEARRMVQEQDQKLITHFNAQKDTGLWS